MSKNVDNMTPEQLDFERRRTIEMLHPELKREMEACATALEMDFDEFMEHLHGAAADDDYFHGTGPNESYYDFNWTKIWLGYELLTGKKVPPSKWGGPRVPFSCAC